jgi:hypothetical protein
VSGRIDNQLAGRIGPEAARALDEHGEGKDCEYRLHRWFENGYTSAIVAEVYEVDRSAKRTTKLVLKTVGTADEPIATSEFARHRRAIQEAPVPFAQAHLAKLWGDPVRVGDGTWLTLQDIAGEGGGEIEPMAVLFAHALGHAPAADTPSSQVVDIDPDGFARACGSVVGTVLREWAGHPHAPDAVDVTTFLRKHVDNHLADPTRLLPYVRRYPDGTINLEGEPRPLPNPFALATGSFFFKHAPLVHMLSGKAHGDLHVENILVAAHPQVVEGNFFLVDLARYEDSGPLTRDPTHLVLHLLARNIASVPADYRDRLIDLLLDPEDRHAPGLLPPWVVKTVTAVDSAGRAWAAESKLVAEWRAQTLLSLVGCALRFVGRKSTRDEDRPWFIRLAARAAAGFVSSVVAEPPLLAEHAGEPDTDRRQPVAELDGITARSAFLRRTLHVHKVHQEVRRTLVDEVVVPALVSEVPGVVVVRGEAGAGKSTIAGQVYDAMVEHGDVTSLVVPCQHIDELPTSVDGFDQVVGELIDAAGPMTAVVQRMVASGRRPVVIFDTVDNLLEQRTGRIVVDLLARLIRAGASVMLTTRPFHFHAWIKPNEARLGGALRTPVSVPLLDREEVLALVSGYLRLHPSAHIADADTFGAHIWGLSADRPAMQLIVRNPYFLLMLCETFTPEGVVPPEMTTSRLCDQYVQVRVYGSRRYPEGHEVLEGKRRLWQLVAGELWRRSGDRLALAVPQSWLDKHADDKDALQDLLSEEVLVRSPTDSTSVQFNHQFLAEFSIAIQLRDHGVKALHALLDGMRDAPGARWFAWPVVRHVLARAHTTVDLDATLDRMDLAENYAYQVAAQGLVEQSFPGYLAKLADHEQNYASLFALQVLHFVDDDKVGEALDLLAEVMGRGDDECASQASTVAGRLAARSAEVAVGNVAAIGGLLDAMLLVRKRRAAADLSETSFPDQLLQNVIGPLTNRSVVLPKGLLAQARSLAVGGTPVGMRGVIGLHLVPGVAMRERRMLLAALLDYRFANKVGERGISLVLRTVEWDLRPSGAPEAAGHGVRPANFLHGGSEAGRQLRAAALAVAAREDPRLRPAVVEAFVTASDSDGSNRALICVQEVVKGGGHAWLLAELAKRPRENLAGIAYRLGGLAKSVALHVSERQARHAWADWLAPLVTGASYGNIEGYLLLGWDDDEHRRRGEKAFALLPREERESVIANFAAKPAPGKDAVVRELLRLLPEAPPLLRVRVMDISGDHEPEGLVDMVASPARRVSAQAMARLEQAARAGRPWVRPELLDRYATSDDPGVRVGLLKVVVLLIRGDVGEADSVVARWVSAAADRPLNGRQSSLEEHVQLILLCHSYLRDGRGGAPTTLDAVIRYVDRLVTSAVPQETGRELVALVKTAASRADEPMRMAAARWITELLDRIDIGDVREGRPFAKETLGKLVECGHITLAGLTARVDSWPTRNVTLLVDLIASHDPAGNRSPLLDVLWEADETDEVRAHIAAIRMRER